MQNSRPSAGGFLRGGGGGLGLYLRVKKALAGNKAPPPALKIKETFNYSQLYAPATTLATGWVGKNVPEPTWPRERAPTLPALAAHRFTPDVHVHP